MKHFYLMAACAVLVTTSLASNLLWAVAFGPATTDLRSRLLSVWSDLSAGLSDLADVFAAAAIARCERQAVLLKRDDPPARDPWLGKRR
jgi:hypothetical protein